MWLFGNIDDTDIERTIAFLPMVCAEGALVIWTRNRTPPDRTPKVRRWFDEHGFDERHFKVIPDSTQAVGAHRRRVDSADSEPVDRIFTFIGYDKLQE